MMSFFKTLSRLLQGWPPQVQLTFIVCCFLLCCLAVVLGESLVHSSSFAAIFVVPIVMASWSFKQRGVLLSVSSVLVFLAILNTLVARSLSWPRSTLFGFLIGGGGF